MPNEIFINEIQLKLCKNNFAVCLAQIWQRPLQQLSAIAHLESVPNKSLCGTINANCTTLWTMHKSSCHITNMPQSTVTTNATTTATSTSTATAAAALAGLLLVSTATTDGQRHYSIPHRIFQFSFCNIFTAL